MVIPTLRGGARFRACLDALLNQEAPPAAIVVVDSGSDDGTVKVATERGARVIPVAQSNFRHGPTRNLGFDALPDVDVVVFMVQDAVPVGPRFLGELTGAFADETLGAVTARQIPPGDAGVLTRSTVERSPFHEALPRRTGPYKRDELAGLDPAAWRALLLLDSIALAVRRPVFEALRFRDTDFGEDALLAYDLLWAGWALGHASEAVVEHGHEYDEDSVAARYERDARFFRECFGLRIRPGLLSVFKGWAAELAADRRWLASHPEHRSPEARRASSSLRWAQVIAQYRGSRGTLGALPEKRDAPGPSGCAA
ncbi:MAG: glycosyltransferase [Planctomycetota bacterium]|nr:glycosyltransferase [Planctomycetota bacterium]